jgi:serine/threonine protein kinase
MPNEESRRLRAVYAAALQRDPEEREAFLSQACADQPELRAKVAALLQAHSQDFETALTSSPEPAAADWGDDIEGKVIGPYIIRRVLGRGGMGIVYLADDKRLSRPVALKALAPGLSREANNRERLRLEARAAAGLSHPGIATVYAVEEIGDELYLASEYVPGESLRALLASGPLPMPQVVSIGAQLVRALAAAHTMGVIHRDIKPENVVKTPSGAIKILDFGLARMEGASPAKLTKTGVVMGTPAYMAPEQALGKEVDFRADLFAVGLLLYELATGVNPFTATTITATIGRIVEVEPPVLSQVRNDSTPELDRIVTTCLRKNPADRYRSTQELLADLEEVEAQMPLLRHHDSANRAYPSASHLARGLTTRRWWELHQLIVSVIYVLTIYPAWYVRLFPPKPWGLLLVLIVLAAAAAGTSLRLHLWFTARYSPADLQSQLVQSRVWTRWCDGGFAALLILGALGIFASHPEFAMLFVTIAVAMLVAALVIEPATVRAAFGSQTRQSSSPG